MSPPVDATQTRPEGGRRGAGCSGAEPSTLYVRLVFSENLPLNAPEVDRVHVLATAPDQGVIVGREPPRGDSIRLPFDNCASRAHARLAVLRAGGEAGVVVEDRGSHNGTFINGQRVRGTSLVRAGGVVRIGGTVFVVGAAPWSRRTATLANDPPPATYHARAWPALALWERVVEVARVDYGVLLLGETGTGKTRLARLLHARSTRGGGPFVGHNCSAIPVNLEEATLFGVVGGFIPGVKQKTGLLTEARGGTLFLDELADMPSLAQAKLLDAFDPTEPGYLPVGASRRLVTDCRIVAATNRDPFRLAAEGVLRQDLLSRLVVTPLTVPPLRERREDIVGIFTACLAREGGGATHGPHLLNAETVEALLLAHWVENVRGLESLARRQLAGEALSPDVIGRHADRGLTLGPEVSAAPQPVTPIPAAKCTLMTAGWPPTPTELLSGASQGSRA